MGRMPDFVIIGAMKCATSTLHEQLAAQQGMFLSEPKELYFFSDDPVYARGLPWYASHFEHARAKDLCGESTTHYTKLPTYPHTIARMRAALPDATLIYVVRHPIQRLVSQYIHEWTENRMQIPIDEAVDAVPELIAYSRYAMQLEPYFQTYGQDRVLLVFFESLVARPQATLERVCRFLGYTGLPVWDETLGQQNASNERMRKSKLRDAISYAPGISHVRKYLVPQSVRDSIKGLWRMRERPTLSPDAEARLQTYFDKDLAPLREWTGLDLTCATWKAIASETDPEWVARPQAVGHT